MTDITPERVRAWLDSDENVLVDRKDLARAYLDRYARVEELSKRHPDYVCATSPSGGSSEAMRLVSEQQELDIKRQAVAEDD